MTNEDIIRMAKESGMYQILDEYADEFGSGMFDITLCDQFPELERFAKLVAEAEREECAKDCEGLSGRSYEFDMGRLHCAAVIRARGKNERRGQNDTR
jgi:hypothetical protein